MKDIGITKVSKLIEDFYAKQTIELCIPFGASYEYRDFVFDARYNLGVSKINKGNGSQRNSVFQFTVGYKFDL